MTTLTSHPTPGVPPGLSAAARRHPAAARRLTAAHAAMVRGTRGLVGARWFGMPVLLLETVGRRTGRPRTTALVYLSDGDDLVVVAANAGAERAPAWWLNLQAAGRGAVLLGFERRQVTADVLDGARRDRVWERFAAVSPVEHYQRHTTRPLPVVALAPLPAVSRAPATALVDFGLRRSPALAAA